MSNISEHRHRFTNGECANKENELSNGKRIEVTKSSSGIDSNFDWAKKEAIHQQRKLRLIQVRQQSKEFASQVRENVQYEEQRQLDKINRIMKDEMLNWRQKQIAATEKDYKHCLDHIGDAHAAAEYENAKQQKIDEQREKNRRLALKRGKIAMDKLKSESNMKQTKSNKSIKEKKVIDHSKKVIDSPDSSSSSSSSTTSPSSSSDCSVASVIEKKKKPEIKAKIAPISSKSSVSPRSSKSKIKSNVRIMDYNPMKYASANSSPATDVSLSDVPLDESPPFITKISDLLGRKPLKPLRSSPYIAKTYKLEKSPVQMRNTPKKAGQKPQINSVSTRLSRTIQTPTKTSGKSPMKMLPERKHFVPEFVKQKPSIQLKKDSSIQTTPQFSSKVQFYDHANKFAKQYSSSIDVEERILNILPLNAWEEAKKDAESDKLKEAEQFHMRMLAENRSKVALEKEKIRKDYELLSSQLSGILKNNELANSFVQANDLLSESRLKEIAKEKQQLMNKEFRKIKKTPVTITAPKVQSFQSTSTKPSVMNRPKMGEINVAAKSTKTSILKKPSVENDLSSDSTHSFLLDCVTERSNNICDDIQRCRTDNSEKSQTKIQALHDLLNQVNAFRRILCEEIKQNNGDISRIDASQFVTEIEKMQEKQQRIMKDKSIGDKKPTDKKESPKKRERDLQERERQLQIKESCINDKARELYLREKKIAEQKKQSKKSPKDPNYGNKQLAIVKTNGVESLDEIPVRIVINVNKNEQIKDKHTDVIVNDVKWCDKLAKSNQLKENIQNVPVTNGKSKMVTMEQKQIDISSQSSTSITAYYSPPEMIKTQLSEILEKSAILKNGKAQQNESPQISDTELLHYIVRMLGMSRTSIEQLNMSSVSTVKTPNSSVINVSMNRQFSSSATSTPVTNSPSISVEQLQSVNKAKLQQLARYLADNNRLGSSARRDSKESGGGSSGMWDDVLSKRTDPVTSKSDKIDNDKSKSIKPAQNVDTDPDDQLSRNDLIAKYDELAANCTKRIINLDSMISKVREEKQKLLENTLSSASSLMTGQKENGTEYLDLPNPEQNQPIQASNNNLGSPLSDSKGTNPPSSSDFSSTSGTAEISIPIDGRVNLFTSKNKLLGESKDSGVGNSRPVTSSDYRESPDLKQNTKPMDQENTKKLLQNALRESKRDGRFEAVLKEIPIINYRIPNRGEKSPEQIVNNGRDKNVKQPPPVAMARYSPQMEDDLPHELSTITEVDTPATSRLNATDATIANESAMTATNSTFKLTTDGEVLKLLYNAFPNIREYIKSNPNITELSMASVNETVPMTDETLCKLLEPQGSKVDELQYKKFDANHPHHELDSKILQDSELHISYAKFPTHAEYAKEIPGLLDSQSIEQMQNSDVNDNSNTNSSLPDIVSELKKRNIIDRSFQENSDKNDGFDDLLMPHDSPKYRSSQLTESCKDDDSFSDTVGNELTSMGLSWANTELKRSKSKAKNDSTSTSLSSDSSKHHGQLNKNSPPKRNAKRTFQKMNQSRTTAVDSFVDSNLAILKLPNDESKVTTQPSETENVAKPVNLKDFLARELLKHSSMSSSSDSSMQSLLLKSYMGQSSRVTPETPQSRGNDKQRTSTPVDHSKVDTISIDDKNESRRGIYTTNSTLNRIEVPPHTFFPNDTQQLSSVRLSTTDSTATSTSTSTSASTFSEDRQK